MTHTLSITAFVVVAGALTLAASTSHEPFWALGSMGLMFAGIHLGRLLRGRELQPTLDDLHDLIMRAFGQHL